MVNKTTWAIAEKTRTNWDHETPTDCLLAKVLDPKSCIICIPIKIAKTRDKLFPMKFKNGDSMHFRVVNTMEAE